MSLRSRLEREQALAAPSPEKKKVRETVDPYKDLKGRIHRQLVEELEKNSPSSTAGEEFEASVRSLTETFLNRDTEYIPRAEKQKIVQNMVNEVVGYGPISPLIDDDAITEIMVNGPFQVYYEKAGKLHQTDIQFRDNDHVLNIIDKIVAPIGRRIDETSPMVDARLPDGSRVNAIIPPLSLTGPCITIRKFSKDPLTIVDLMQFGSLSPEMTQLLEACVKARLNVLVSGGTGSGKTTLLNCLSAFIPENERIITIEDAAEVQLHQPHVITLETRPANIEGTGAITIRDLVRNSLRMRPNRIVVGEVRGGEALDMLQAMNTGHDGSLTTVHANTPRDMLARLETMVLMAGMDLPLKAIREQVAGAVDVIVQQSRFRDGTRKITYITEVTGMESDTIVTQDIYKYQQTGIGAQGRIVGSFQATGIVPQFYDSLKSSGIHLPEGIFEPPRTSRGGTRR